MPRTLETLARYARFRGDADLWCRSAEGRVDTRGADDWTIVDALLTQLRSRAAVPVSARFEQELAAQLDAHAPDPAVRARLFRLAAEARGW